MIQISAKHGVNESRQMIKIIVKRKIKFIEHIMRHNKRIAHTNRRKQ